MSAHFPSRANSTHPYISLFLIWTSQVPKSNPSTSSSHFVHTIWNSGSSGAFNRLGYPRITRNRDNAPRHSFLRLEQYLARSRHQRRKTCTDGLPSGRSGILISFMSIGLSFSSSFSKVLLPVLSWNSFLSSSISLFCFAISLSCCSFTSSSFALCFSFISFLLSLRSFLMRSISFA